MAHLNVRDRRVEAKVAYVGPELSGKWTNLEQLGKREGAAPAGSDGDVAFVSYRAPESAHFRDCDVMVNVVAQRGALSIDGIEAMLRGGDVDGLVLVLDARAAARDSNRAAAKMVHDALSSRKLPVVVQMNKCDSPDALAEAEMAADLGESWPLVAATAKTGDGVVETIDRMLSDVLDALRQSTAQSPLDRSQVQINAPAGGVRVEGNPLLAALRQILRDTVSEHLDQLEARMTVKLDSRVQRIVEAARASNEPAKDYAPAIAELQRSVASIAEQMAWPRDDDAPVLGHLEVLATRLADMHKRLAALGTKDDLAKAVDARATSDRELTENSFATVRRSLEALSTSLKVQDARPRISEALSAISEVAERVNDLGTVSRPKATRDEVEAIVKRQMNDVVVGSLAALDTSLRALREESEQARTHVDATTTEIQAQIVELIEELKKRKKGWFA